MAKPGERLHNNSMLIAQECRPDGVFVVLAEWGGEYVTWTARAPSLRDTGDGNYFPYGGASGFTKARSLADAAADFAKRVGPGRFAK